MSNTSAANLGSVNALWRYPVKSMMGEEMKVAEFTQRGIIGDRSYALIDPSNGKVVSAKNPRKWGALLDFQANFIEAPRAGEKMPPVEIALTDGSVMRSDDSNVNALLSSVLKREVRLGATPPEAASLEEYWPPIDGLAHQDTVTDETIAMAAPGTFFDCAPVHILTTGTLERLKEAYPSGLFDVRRFRPNILVESAQQSDFVENAWVGQTLAVGDAVRLRVINPCFRCVMTILPQGDLPNDPGILRTAVQQNNIKGQMTEKVMPSVGVYAVVVRGGRIGNGDPVRFAKSG
jgi:uncharacterized protein YcbX